MKTLQRVQDIKRETAAIVVFVLIVAIGVNCCLLYKMTESPSYASVTVISENLEKTVTTTVSKKDSSNRAKSTTYYHRSHSATAPSSTAASVVSTKPNREKHTRYSRSSASIKSISHYTEEDFEEAAEMIGPYTKVPENLLPAHSEQETNLSQNQGKANRAEKGARSIKEQWWLDFVATDQVGLQGLHELPVSVDAAYGHTHVRATYVLRHCRIDIDFGNTPVILLHGTEAYRNMSQRERVAGIKVIQRKLGLRGSEVDGVAGSRTLAAIEQAVGVRSFHDRVAKFRLVKKFFSDQVRIIPNPGEDKVFERICLAQGKDPKRTEYFFPNLYLPLHALAYTSIHLEDDLWRAEKWVRDTRSSIPAMDIAVAAYFCGIGNAIKSVSTWNRGKPERESPEWYKNEINLKAKKYNKRTVYLAKR